MKKVVSILMTMIVALSFAACGAKQDTTKNSDQKKTETISSSDSSFKAKDVAVFTDILDNISNKDYFYSDSLVVKINDKKAFKDYQVKAEDVLKKAMADKNVDMKNSKSYTYYKNVNGDRMEKDFIVVYDDSKNAKEIYEVTMKISDKDEPAFSETKKLDKVVDDKFKELFKKDLEAVK